MSVEDRLRAALHAEAAEVEARDASWDSIERRTSGAHRGRLIRNAGLVILLAAAVTTVLIALPVLRTDEGERVQLATEPPTPTSTTVVLPVLTPSSAVWSKTFSDPETAATAFATEYLGMQSPTVVASDADAEYLVRAKAGRGPFTRVITRFENGAWVVTGAASDNLQLTTPAANALVGSPVELRGRSRSFEAHVNVEVRQVEHAAGQSLASTFFTGGGGGATLESFSASISFRPSSAARGAILLLVYSAEDGSLSEATVVPVRF
jgi:hypothetical protein